MGSRASCRWSIDQPKPLFATNGGMQFAGWCFDEEDDRPLDIRLMVGANELRCDSGLARVDVAAAFPAHKGAHSSGFAFRGWVPVGYQMAHLEARARGGEWIRLKSLPLCSEIAPLVGRIESPFADVVDEGLVKISGWAFHPQVPVEELTLQINGSSVACHYGLPREDVGARFPAVPQSDRCGFECEIALPDDGGVVKLKARLQSGAIVLSEPGKTIQLIQGRARTFLESLDQERASLLSFPVSAHPLVSIVIGVYNQIEVTLACLRSILRHTAEVEYEVIVVDDHSSESTSAILQRVQGLQLLTNETNMGFLRSCNKAAAQARGQYLLFLNNDAEVTQGWLTKMLNTLTRYPDGGLVGAKLIYPDGRLQEAGGIIWRDASGVNYGKGDDADKPEYNFLREVDYCSGACLLIANELFHELGGFDPVFTPAYYEDTDLAFKVRKSGRKVYYQPRAVVVHHEGKTSGTNTDSGVKSYQLVNQEKFRSKWESVLADAATGRPDEIRRASRRGTTRKALVVDARVPCPDQDSGSLRMVKLLEIFGKLGFHVTFAPYNRQRTNPYTAELQRSGIECLYEPYFESFETLLSARGAEFDLILLSRAETAATVLPICRAIVPSIPVVFDTVDLHFVRHQREAELTGEELARKRAEEFEGVELTAARECDAVLVVSAEEKDVLASQLPQQRIAVVSNIHEPFARIAPREGRHGLLFIGGFEHTPNVDAMLWFCQEIMPRILEQLPEAILHIVGSKMPESISGLAGKSVVAHGFVQNVEAFFGSCLLSVAPLRFGAGVKGKINQSTSYGLPVVSTSIGVEGMHLVHEENALVADDPLDFATQVVRLHRDAILWAQLSQNGLKNISQYFSFEAAKRNLRAVLCDLNILPRGDTELATTAHEEITGSFSAR